MNRVLDVARGHSPLALGLLGCAFFLPLTLVGAQLFAYASVLGWVVLVARRQAPWRDLLQPVAIGGLVYATLCVASIWVGIRPEQTLSKIYRLSLVLLIPAVRHAARGDPRLSLRLAATLVTACALRGVYDLARFPVHVWVRHLAPPDFGNMRDPQFYMVGVFLALALLRLGLAIAPRKRVGVLLALALCLLGVVLHQKRGVWVAFALAFVVLTACWRRWSWLLLLVVGAGLIAVLPVTRDRLKDLEDIWNPKRGDRALIWKKIAPKLIAAHPYGMGYKSLTNADLKAVHPGVQVKLNHLHNNWLQVTLELGWLGVTAWTLWMLAVLLAFTRVRHDPDPAARALATGWAVAFLALLLNGLVESNFGDNEIFMLMMLVAGVAGTPSSARGVFER